ncbi:hypothetical protein BDW59DRAFT_147194 [Aspergillus cavernicola]|uniref:Translation initiation factor IF-2, mitochondrial n=1 Tax=Aspergillus cavernicola TaxID=176166 RepID=A0ABR4ICL0_9EURO
MHRRTIVQLSRRHGVKWLGAARLPDAAIILPTRRCFHPSPSCLSSSDPFSSNNSNATNGSSASPKVTPKFGSRWGSSRQTQQPAALSPEEQASRKALLDKSALEEEQRQQRRQRQQQQRQEQRQQQTGPQRGPRPQRPLHSQVVLRSDSGLARLHASLQSREDVDQPPQRRDLPYVFINDKESLNLQPHKEFEVNGSYRLAKHLRSTDWICPECGYSCFGKHALCPSCKARRPIPRNLSLRPPPSRSNAFRGTRSDNPEESHPNITGQFVERPPAVRRIRSADVFKTDGELDSRLYPKESALRKHIAAQQNDTEEQGELDDRRHRWRSDSARLKESKVDETELKKTEMKADPWSWDQSSLDRLNLSEERVGYDTKPKRREGRRQRESEGGEEFDIEDHRHRHEKRKRLKKEKSRNKDIGSAPTPLYLPAFISVRNLADVVGTRPAQFVKRMEEMGFENVSYSHVLDAEISGLIATEFGFEPILDTSAEDDLTAEPEPEDKSIWPPRPPVVTIMGHVDHGKTTILDWLRKSSVVASEHGGITQHIGAFSVSMPSGKMITFLDTPGHAAFLEMRQRGANVTDIVVLVVAADDSVKPQTIEAIKHATGAKVPVIVAISKIDREGINPEKVKQDLSVHGINVEDYGGDVQAIGVSGKTGQGMLELEEAIITLSEVLDHRADPSGVVEGWVVEATTKSYGRVATVLVRRGTLRPGDIIVAGNAWARVRTLRNEAGVSIAEATPGTPVEVDGWREQPLAGSEVLQAGDEQHAKDVVDYRLEKSETLKLGEDTTAINDARRELLEKRQREASGDDQSTAEEKPSGPKPVHFVIKADVGGSAEAVMNSTIAVGNNEVYANVLRSEVGPISEFDIEHAAAANGQIISFNMPIDPAMSRMAESRGVRIIDHNIIYKLVDDVKATLSEQLAPLITHRVTGEADVGQVFEITLKGRVKTSIAGCKVRNGMINRTKKVRVLRGQEIIYTGSISSLKNVKKDVTEMRKDTECGLAFENWTEFAIGDQIQCYDEISEKRYL